MIPIFVSLSWVQGYSRRKRSSSVMLVFPVRVILDHLFLQKASFNWRSTCCRTHYDQSGVGWQHDECYPKREEVSRATGSVVGSMEYDFQRYLTHGGCHHDEEQKGEHQVQVMRDSSVRHSTTAWFIKFSHIYPVSFAVPIILSSRFWYIFLG